MILTIDIGSSSLKSALISSEGKLIGYHRQPYPDLFESRDPSVWTRALASSIKKLSPLGVSAVSLCGNGPTLVPLDKKDRPLGRVIFWRDTPPDTRFSSYYLPGLLRFKDNDPENYGQTALFLPTAEYLCFLLTGEKVAVSPHNGFDKKLWQEKELSTAGLAPEKMPPIRPFANPVGRVSPRASDEWGLPQGIPVYCPGSDFMAALIGTNTLTSGKTCDRAGSSEGINHATCQPVSGPGLRCLPHLRDNLYNTAAFPGQTGLIFEHYRRILEFSSMDYPVILTRFLSWKPSADSSVFLPGDHGEGSFVGERKASDNHEKMNLVLATLACLFSRAVENLEAAGLPLREIVTSGGQAKNIEWNRVKASISGKQIHIPLIPDGELTGCAVLALADRERIPLESVTTNRVIISQRIDPDDKLRSSLLLYKEQFENINRTSSIIA